MTEDWLLVAKATEYVADEMGVALRRSALSPNIRERMDHSCAVLDLDGRIVAQAEHIPVHLGSFRIGARNALAWLHATSRDLRAHEMLVFNDPYLSGTHLNDVTVLAPIRRSGRGLGWVITKAHHVDVGGPVPGSLNPDARTLDEEGLVISPTVVDTSSDWRSTALARAIETNFRDPETGRGDLAAQFAANRRGIAGVSALVERFGTRGVADGWREAIDHGRALARDGLARFPRRTAYAEDELEGPTSRWPIRVKIAVTDRGVRADFAGSHPEVPAPFNAVFGVTYSAVAFAVRCLLPDNVPTNEGFYGCLDVRAPLGSIVNPHSPAAVGGGNVETSQRVADVTLRALSRLLPARVPAASAGTMMNLMMGGVRRDGRRWAYYETIGGGSGGRPRSDGVSGVHTNMTNTLNTPIEVAEHEYPLEFVEYHLRPGSGGPGRYRGGDGIVRAFRVTEPTVVSILADRFELPPWGLRGGGPGRTARISVTRGRRPEVWPSKARGELEAGDELRIETPGGGGYGLAASLPHHRSSPRSHRARPPKKSRRMRRRVAAGAGLP